MRQTPGTECPRGLLVHHGSMTEPSHIFASSATHDLRSFFQAVGQFSGERALNTETFEREEPEVPAELLDEKNSKVTADPLPIDAFLDGIQASLLVTHRAHRPVYLSYVAAGAVSRGATPVGLKEKLTIFCSTVDREWVDSLSTTIPVEEIACETPPDVEKAALQILRSDRDSLEKSLGADLVEALPGYLVLDGSVMFHQYSTKTLGVVKTTRRKYLADESCLFGLPVGWRSPRFKISAGHGGGNIDRYSTYLRMFDASTQAWNFGLIRLEAYDPDLLDGLAAACLRERQSSAGGDARFDRHLASVRACEEFLRSRRPSVFSLG